MKTMFFKNGLLTLLMSAFMILALPSCDKEEETPELPLETSIVGTWDITSYNLDGDEWMGLIIEAAFVTFEEPTNNSGIFIQEVTFADDEPMSLSGRYILDPEKMQVTMYYEGEPIVADIVITGGNKMHWESLQDEYPLVLKATKRL
jgi:hypothetical protein